MKFEIRSPEGKVVGMVVESLEETKERHKKIREGWPDGRLSLEMSEKLDNLEYTLSDGEGPLFPDRKDLVPLIKDFRNLRKEYVNRKKYIGFQDNEVASLTSHLKYVPIAD